MLAGPLDARQHVIPGDGVPAHVAGELIAAVDEIFKVSGMAGEPLVKWLRSFLGDGVFNFIALGLADRQELLGAQGLGWQIGVIGDDDVGGGATENFLGYFFDETPHSHTRWRKRKSRRS